MPSAACRRGPSEGRLPPRRAQCSSVQAPALARGRSSARSHRPPCALAPSAGSPQEVRRRCHPAHASRTPAVLWARGCAGLPLWALRLLPHSLRLTHPSGFLPLFKLQHWLFLVFRQCQNFPTPLAVDLWLTKPDPPSDLPRVADTLHRSLPELQTCSHADVQLANSSRVDN